MESGAFRERLYEVFADADRDVGERIERALEVGSDYLDLPLGFFTRIEDETQEIVHVTGRHELIRPGETCPLRDAYCRRTIERDGALAVQNAADSVIDQRAIETFDLGTYIGAKVVVDDEVYGTVCFADHDERDAPFTETEELFLELLAKLVGWALEQRAYERDLREQNAHLERQKQRFQGIAENSFDVLFRVDLDARFTYVSSAVERVLGYDPERLTGETIDEFMTERSAEDAAAVYSRVLDGERVENLELDFLDREGTVVVLEVNATPITDDGDVVGAQGVGRDLTARKEQERELRMKTRAMDEAAVGISIADLHQPDEPLVYVNDGFERITGYDADDALGRNCRFLQGDATDPEAVDRLRAAIDAGESVTVELINYRRDESPFWNRVQLDPVFDETGTRSHYLGFQEDVTGRRRNEQLIRLLNRVLRHNLRNDMTALVGWAEMIHSGDADDVRDAAARIERISRDLVALSEHARELERHAHYERSPQRLDPSDLVADIAATHRDRFPKATIDVTVRTDRGICAGTELERAVAELVENAVKHASSSEPTVAISVTDDAEWVELAVVDDGPGIDGMEIETVSTGSETALQHGSGLGLWLVNWIVTRYGGSFQVEARGADGTEGTTATVRLPAIDDDTSVEAAARRPTVLFH
ncbi:MAG: PAS domain S-box protein [Haloferacaceae archaeon]